MTPRTVEAAPGIWVATHQGPPARHLLTDEDLAGAGRLPGWQAAQHLAGRSALRHLLTARFPEAARARVVYGPHGRPELAGLPRIDISVSHDGELGAACAARDRAVGVDIQHAPEVLRPGLLRRCLKQHAPVLDRLPPARRNLEFAWVWTVQEACVKAAGTGLSGRPWAIDVTPLTRLGSWGAYRWVSLREHSPVPLSCAFAEPPAASTFQEAA
ncbi:4'-phosphopantetheinyl transferase superfamily protein [Streptomyces sp. ISL-11]|uniref:4'-phosphopantetheinyl transferase family protein n=1 Tax=Streptomyces sp. ISL-11 TaxID=2819174 RepID=UPI001BE57CC7|nr:4'-phosphopantetheinyl transferase superfamily protein [Streptomyces sp. ISL-11]MBT2383216.1 4'-phosphopantetheinyl transferase superfamily protein [Streptomyces sp. ISL-11]